MFRIAELRTMYIMHRSTERLGQKLGIKIQFLSQLSMYGDVLLKTL